MFINASELKGAALDWAVAKARGFSEIRVFRGTRHTEGGWVEVRFNPEPKASTARYSPSSEWAHGGPIIEQESISLERSVKLRGCSVVGFHDWRAISPKNYGGLIRYSGSGPTALVAAMRCFIASRLGDKIDVPDALCVEVNLDCVERME